MAGRFLGAVAGRPASSAVANHGGEGDLRRTGMEIEQQVLRADRALDQREERGGELAGRFPGRVARKDAGKIQTVQRFRALAGTACICERVCGEDGDEVATHPGGIELRKSPGEWPPCPHTHCHAHRRR